MSRGLTIRLEGRQSTRQIRLNYLRLDALGPLPVLRVPVNSAPDTFLYGHLRLPAKHFLSLVNVGPGSDNIRRACVECRVMLEPGDHYFSSAVGGVLCPACRVKSDDALILISLNAMKVLRFLQRDADYTGAAELKVSSRLQAEIERLLHAYVRFLVERELKSAEFMSLVSSDATTYLVGRG